MEPVVQLKNVKKTIKNKDIIKGISFDIFPGEVFGLLGPNGAGKTTTIRMLLGLITMSDGDILIKKKSIRNHFEEAISNVGGIVENPDMYKFLSGYDNLKHYARMVKGVSKERIDEVVKLVGLENRIKEKVKTYSLGMRQRLGLAQALLHSPSLLILDEPTNGLDPAGIREFREYLRKLAREENMAIVVSSHLLSEMELMCDRIGIIQNGELIGVQNINEFIDDENVVQFKVEPVEEVKQSLKGLISEEAIVMEDHAVLLKIDEQQIPEVTKMLVEAGIKIYQIKTVAKTLEDKFLQVTGGNQIV